VCGAEAGFNPFPSWQFVGFARQGRLVSMENRFGEVCQRSNHAPMLIDFEMTRMFSLKIKFINLLIEASSIVA
jgi:hypothetical protein